MTPEDLVSCSAGEERITLGINCLRGVMGLEEITSSKTDLALSTG
jgi:protein tyrosine/serine phosphatase